MIALDRALLQEIVPKVLEECAFLCTEPSPDLDSWPERVTRISLTFVGDRSGSIELFAGPELALGVAADMLGVDASDPDAERLADGALAEITNVITGALVAQLFGTGCLCHLGIPIILHEGPGATPQNACAITLVDLEGRPLHVQVRLGEPS